MKKDARVQLGHGGGGILQSELIEFITKNITLKQINGGVAVNDYDDGATIPLSENIEYFKETSGEIDIVVSADGHTISPLKFPGGDLGELSVSGTVNDLIMMGSTPIAMTSVVLIEEGTPFELLGEIMNSFNKTAEIAKVAILAGDSKVMPKGSLKDIVISTTGIGIKPQNVKILDNNCNSSPNAKIIITGSIGDHGASIIAKREGIDLETTLESDVQLLSDLQPIIKKYHEDIYAMKDPTRGGVSSALNEWATKSKVSIWIQEVKIPIKKEVQAISDILGLDPMDIANEGKALLCISKEKAEEILAEIKALPLGKDAQIIGEVRQDKIGKVFMETPLGGHRIIEKPMGEVIPRIC